MKKMWETRDERAREVLVLNKYNRSQVQRVLGSRC